MPDSAWEDRPPWPRQQSFRTIDMESDSRCALMRSLPSLLVVPLAALASMSCLGPGEGPPPRQNETVERPLYRVSGRVIDWRTNRAVTNAVIAVSGTRVTSDSLGNYTALVDSGMVHFTIVHQEYEAYDQSFLIQSPRPLDLHLRRLAPLITCFEVDGDSIVARVIDLQHRKTIHRSTSTNVTLSGPDFELILLGNQWTWDEVDDFTYVVILRPGRTGVQQAIWHILDKTGIVFTATCTAPFGCDHGPTSHSHGCRTPPPEDVPPLNRLGRSPARRQLPRKKLHLR